MFRHYSTLTSCSEIERLGDLYRGYGLVFTSEVGTLMNPTNLRRLSFAPLLERAGYRRYASTTCTIPARAWC